MKKHIIELIYAQDKIRRAWADSKEDSIKKRLKHIDKQIKIAMEQIQDEYFINGDVAQCNAPSPLPPVIVE